ncbi:MAG: site-specific integrase [Endomicrobium sp.]|nr:site-specific integrase [Endomicrobium sp.]
MKFLAEIQEMTNISEGAGIDPKELNWETISKLFLAFSKQTKDASERDERTIKLVEKILNPVFLKDLTTDKLREYIRKRKEKGIKESSINREMNTIRSLFTYAINERKIPINNPTKNIKPFVLPLVDKEDYFTHEHWETIKREIKSELIKSSLYVMLYTATRLKEATFIKWAHILFDQDLVRITPFKTRKSNPNPVYIPLHAKLKPYLQELRAKHPEAEYVINLQETRLKRAPH